MKRIALVPALVSGLVCSMTGLAALPADGTAPPASGEEWHYRAQIDGRGGPDRITITTGPGFTLADGLGTGQVLVHVDFAGGRGFAEIQQDVSYYSVRTPWTPWLGATDLDRRGGKEIVLGFTTGAHTQGFDAYAYRSDGELLTLRAPRREPSWIVNSSYGTGTSGWRCTRRGVQARTVSPCGGPTVKITRTSYVMGRSGDWRRTDRAVRTVGVDASGNPPAYTARYARFACAGLPKRVL